MEWKGILNIAKKTLSNNKATVLFASGVLCLGTCAILTAKSTPEAVKRMETINYDISSKPKPRSDDERLKLMMEKTKRMALEVAPVYIPAITAGVLSVVAFGLSNRDISKEAAGAVAACSVAEKALNAYQENVVKELGEEVNERILKNMVDDVPEKVLKAADGYLTDDMVANNFPPDINDKLYYDHVTGRLFWSSDEKIRDAESTVNKLLIDVGMATINDFYNALLLDCDSVIGDAIGWRIEDPHARNMDVIFGSRLDRENNTPLITIGYRTCAVNLRELERR